MKTSAITSQADLIGAVPQLLGYPPQNSLVVLTAHRQSGGGQLMGVCMRFDFDLQVAAGLDEGAARGLARTLSRADTVDRVFPFVFSDDVPAALGLAGADRDDTVFALYEKATAYVCDALVEQGVQVYAPAWVGCGMTGPMDRPGRAARLQHSTGRKPVDLGTGPVQADFGQAAALPRPVAEVAQRVSLLRPEEPDPARLIEAIMADVVALYDSAQRGARAEPVAPSPLAIIAFEVLTEDLWVRDLIEMMLGFDHPQLPPDLLRTMSGEEFARTVIAQGDRVDMAAQMIGLSERRPDMQLTKLAADYLRAVASYVDVETLPTVLSMIAWFEWARARHSFAAHYAQAALDLDPRYSLAGLMLRAADAGMPPAWLAARENGRDD